MDIRALLVCFSPTGTTKRILFSIASGLGGRRVYRDLTTPAGRNKPIDTQDCDIAVIGVPVYEETVPPIAEDALRSLKGFGKPAVLVAVYGNIGYGMALKRLKALAEAAGFVPVAAAAFVGEHSFSCAEAPVAAGRPDAADLDKAVAFGQAVRHKLEADLPNTAALAVPGRLPLMARILPRDSARLFTREPALDISACSRCGACARLCPAGAIDGETYQIDGEACLRCFCCVKRCPKRARRIEFRKKPLVKLMLRLKGGRRREPVTFL